MSSFWDNWASAYRTTRAVGAAIALGSVLLVMSVLGPSEPVSVHRTTGTVLEVHAMGSGSGRYGAGTTSVGLVRLADGGEARIYLQPPIPQPGAEVPLRVETDADGDRRATLDLATWRGY